VLLGVPRVGVCAMPLERPRDVPPGLSPLEALQVATDAIRSGYVLRETMQHPEVRAECMELAHLIQVFGLPSTNPARHHDEIKKLRDLVTGIRRLQDRREYFTKPASGCERVATPSASDECLAWADH
jgi:hypothetical protein